jgi:hypothetical protein
MQHLLAGENLGLIVCRQQARADDDWGQVFATSRIAESCAISNVTREINYILPLYLYPGIGKADDSLFSRWQKGKNDRTPNLESEFVDRLGAAVELRFVSDGRGDFRETFGPEDVLAYVYAVFHSTRYRQRYEAQLKLDFPRVPTPGGAEFFTVLAELGHDMLALHLLESPKFEKPTTELVGGRNPEVEKVSWANNTVWLDKAQATGFKGVREDVWNFHIGGYQVCEKWLKDRKGRRLSKDDIAHYQKIVVALAETIRLMKEIDEVIDHHGGWPGAFQAPREAALPLAAEAHPEYRD